MDQHQCGPGRHDGQGAGQHLHDPRGRRRLCAEVEEAQPDQRGQPPGDTGQCRDLEQHQRAAIGPHQQHHQQQVQHQQHGARQGVFDAGQLQPLPQADQQHGGSGGGQPLRRQQQDRGNGHRRHDQRGEYSGLGHGLEVSVASVQRLLQQFGIEVRPQGLGEPQLGVGQLPQQEVADAGIAAGADEQVRGRQVGQGHLAAQQRFVDLFGQQAARGHFHGQGARGTGDILAATVAGGDRQGQGGVVSGALLGQLHAADQAGTEALAFTDEAHAHATPVQLVHFAVERAEEQLHQRIDFFLRPAPVLAGEREQGQRGNAQFKAALDGAVDRARAGTVADHARAAALLRPTAVAIHDDGNVAGQGSRQRRRD
ncbi:hypothetical protein G6F22_010861 [Rhizopus arrhizus]|nr:hypothetical protein G6F22_010861 [Rhizopus arrhizus]